MGEWVSERANEWAERSARALRTKRTSERCEQMAQFLTRRFLSHSTQCGPVSSPQVYASVCKGTQPSLILPSSCSPCFIIFMFVLIITHSYCVFIFRRVETFLSFSLTPSFAHYFWRFGMSVMIKLYCTLAQPLIQPPNWTSGFQAVGKEHSATTI